VNSENHYHRRKQLLWGLLLIVLGALFLLDRLELLDLDLRRLWHYWPVLLVAFGINKMLAPTSARRILGGLWLIGFAAWYYVSFERLWGLSFATSWPLLLIGWGAGLVLEPLLNQHFASKEQRHGK
jgi:hypothetical protein